MATRNTLLRDVLFFIKDDLNTNLTDPISSTRGTKSKFVMTSYPQRPVEYPLITIKIPNLEAKRAGMQSTQLDIVIDLEVRVWARNEKEKDEIYTELMDHLANIQFTGSGSIANDFHDFNILSSNEIDEEGTGIKSRIVLVQYKFYG